MTLRARSLAAVTLALAPAMFVAAPMTACGPSTPIAVVPSATPSVSVSASASASASVVAAPLVPKPLPASVVGTFADGTFGPRVVRPSDAPTAASASTVAGLVVTAPRAATGRRWIAQAIDASDRPIADGKHELGEAPEDTTSWDVQPVDGGYLLAWTRPTDAGVQLMTLALRSDGTPTGTARAITRSGEEIVGVRLIPMKARGADVPAALLTYGERTTIRGTLIATGALLALPIDATGAPTTSAPPLKIGNHLSAWQVTPLSVPGGALAMVSLVQQQGLDKLLEKKAIAGELSSMPADASRAPKVLLVSTSSRALVASDATLLAPPRERDRPAPLVDTALPEVEAVETSPGRALVVFGDRRDLDAHLFAAAIDASGTTPKIVSAPRRATPPRGDQSLSALVAVNGGAVMLWETLSPHAIGEERRTFSLARLTADGEMSGGARSFFLAYELGDPQIVARPSTANPDAVALLTYANKCRLDAEGAAPSCTARTPRPMIVELSGPSLDAKRAVLIDVGDAATPIGGEALGGYDLACTKASCEVLVDGPGDPATYAIVRADLDAAPALPRWTFEELATTSALPPRLETAATIAREARFSSVRAVRTTSGGSAAAWITYAAEDEEVDARAEGKKKRGEDKRDKSAGARVAVRVTDANGEATGSTTTISERAVSKGGVAIAWSQPRTSSDADRAKAKPGDGGGMVAYVSRIEGDEEVFTERIDAQGRRVGGANRITHIAGGASDVAIVSLPHGDRSEPAYLVAWVDARKESAAVYAARLDETGEKMGLEAKIGGGAGGDVSSVSASVIGLGSGGPKVAIAWSDARADAATGFADVFFSIVSGRDLGKVISPERAILKTSLHSHDPLVVARGDGGALIGWLEDDPSSNEMLQLLGGPDWGAYLARVDGTGALVMPPTKLGIDATLGAGVVTGIGADCSAITSGSGCRVALAWSASQGIGILGGALNGSTLTPARMIWSYRGAPTQEVTPAVAGSAIFFGEDGMEVDDGKVRRLGVAW